jgi:hypothetical protein
MIRKLFFILVIFLAGFLHLQQKVLILVEAYRLNELHNRYQKLVDSRDMLLYNFTKNTSLADINCWAEVNGFRFSPQRKVLALNTGTGETNLDNNAGRRKGLASYFNRIFRWSFAPGALAQGR